jgi:hypothetical protein
MDIQLGIEQQKAHDHQTPNEKNISKKIQKNCTLFFTCCHLMLIPLGMLSYDRMLEI